MYKLRPVEFDFIDNDKHSIGLIAEEVVNYIPEVVVTNVNNSTIIEGVNYEHLIAPLIKIIQEYRVQINDLQLRVTNLEK